jgi:GNAT superfamily N-acetyltransferase
MTVKNEICIRPFHAAQIALLVPLFEAQFREHNISSSSEVLVAALESLRDKPQHGFILTAISDDLVVGVAYGACILSLEHGGWSGWLEELYILPEWRNRGVGSQLLTAVIAAAHQQVISLYTRFDFKPVPRTRFVRRFLKNNP